MADITNRFKTWLGATDSRRPIGTWLMSAAPATAEAMGYVGFDFLVVDMEHVPIGISDLVSILRAVGCTPAEPVVRIAWNDQIIVKRVMDAGAKTVMLPYIQSAEDAKRAASFMRYPPIGARGVAAMHRASKYGRAANYLGQANREICTIVQLETPEAIDQLAAIAAVEGIDALFVGPGDLAAAMGHIGNVAHPDVQALIAKAAKDARSAGKPVGIVGPNPDMVHRFIDYGYDFTAIGSDMAMMIDRAASWLDTVRGARQSVQK